MEKDSTIEAVLNKRQPGDTPRNTSKLIYVILACLTECTNVFKTILKDLSLTGKIKVISEYKESGKSYRRLADEYVLNIYSRNYLI